MISKDTRNARLYICLIQWIEVLSQSVAARSTRFEDRKESILNSAAELINRHGLRDATLAVIAAEIGLNLKSLRYYFKRREDLVSAAFLRSIALHRKLVEDAAAGPDVHTRVHRFVTSYFELQADIVRGDHPHFVHFGDVRALAPPHSVTVFQAYNDLFRSVRSMLREPLQPLERPVLNASAHMLISQLLWSVVWISGYLPEDYARVGERFADILWNGIATRPVDLSSIVVPARISVPESDRLTPDSFLLAATESINAQGYRGAAVERISSALNVTKGAFYHHNDNRDDLVVACFERTFDIIRTAQNEALARELDGMSRVAAAAASLVSRQMTPDGVMLRTSALTAIGPELRELMARRMNIHTMRFADMLGDGVADGSTRPCDLRIAAEMVTAMINSAEEIDRWVPGVNAENVTGLYVAPLLGGLRTNLERAG